MHLHAKYTGESHPGGRRGRGGVGLSAILQSSIRGERVTPTVFGGSEVPLAESQGHSGTDSGRRQANVDLIRLRGVPTVCAVSDVKKIYLPSCLHMKM